MYHEKGLWLDFDVFSNICVILITKRLWLLTDVRNYIFFIFDYRRTWRILFHFIVSKFNRWSLRVDERNNNRKITCGDRRSGIESIGIGTFLGKWQNCVGEKGVEANKCSRDTTGVRSLTISDRWSGSWLSRHSRNRTPCLDFCAQICTRQTPTSMYLNVPRHVLPNSDIHRLCKCLKRRLKSGERSFYNRANGYERYNLKIFQHLIITWSKFFNSFRSCWK